MFKKLIAFLLCALMLTSLSACGSKGNVSNGDSGNAETASQSSSGTAVSGAHAASEPEISMIWNVFPDEENVLFTYLRFYGWGTCEYAMSDGTAGTFYWEMPETGKIAYHIKENGEWVERSMTAEADSSVLLLTDGESTVKYEGLFPPQYSNELCGVYKTADGACMTLCPDGYGRFLSRTNVLTYLVWSGDNGTLSINVYTEQNTNLLWSEDTYSYTLEGETLVLTDSTGSVTYTRTSKINIG